MTRKAGEVLLPYNRNLLTNMLSWDWGSPALVPTPQQLRVLHHLADGLPQKKVARAMGISFRTVAAHVWDMKKRSGIETSTGLVAAALRQGLVR